MRWVEALHSPSREPWYPRWRRLSDFESENWLGCIRESQQVREDMRLKTWRDLRNDNYAADRLSWGEWREYKGDIGINGSWRYYWSFQRIPYQCSRCWYAQVNAFIKEWNDLRRPHDWDYHSGKCRQALWSLAAELSCCLCQRRWHVGSRSKTQPRRGPPETLHWCRGYEAEGVR